MVNDQVEHTPDLYGGKLTGAGTGMGSHHVPHLKHHCEILQGQGSDLGRGTQTQAVRLLRCMIKETPGQRPGTRAMCISLGYPQIRA